MTVPPVEPPEPESDEPEKALMPSRTAATRKPRPITTRRPLPDFRSARLPLPSLVAFVGRVRGEGLKAGRAGGGGGTGRAADDPGARWAEDDGGGGGTGLALGPLPARGTAFPQLGQNAEVTACPHVLQFMSSPDLFSPAYGSVWVARGCVCRGRAPSVLERLCRDTH